MPDAGPPPEWLEAANRLATVARQLTTVVHETNNLLQIVSGNAEMMEASGALSERDARRAQVIAEHARRASQLLGQVMTFARDPEDGASRFDLAEAAAAATALRHYAATKARLEVVLDAPEPVWVVANRRRTLQVLLNVLMNAETALAGREDGRIRIAIAREGSRGVVTVDDNGPGWTDEGAVFTVRRAAPGAPPPLGIGLRVAAWLAGVQDGALTVKPTADGTTVVLALPAD